MKPTHLIPLLLAFTVLLGACAARDPLADTAWQLSAFGSTPPLEGTTLTARFSDRGVGGSTGCNGYGGRYAAKGDKITLDSLFQTEMACLEPEGVMEQERMFLEWLGAAERFEVTSERLLLYRADGEALVFVPQE